jgi:hypothetical protein
MSKRTKDDKATRSLQQFTDAEVRGIVTGSITKCPKCGREATLAIIDMQMNPLKMYQARCMSADCGSWGEADINAKST